MPWLTSERRNLCWLCKNGLVEQVGLQLAMHPGYTAPYDGLLCRTWSCKSCLPCMQVQVQRQEADPIQPNHLALHGKLMS
jgi:hypothetical protein